MNVESMIDDRIACLASRGLVAGGPNSPFTFNRRIGVTDGSDAEPGEIGEFHSASVTFDYIGYPTAQNGVSPAPPNVPITKVITFPAGDWDMWAYQDFYPLHPADAARAVVASVFQVPGARVPAGMFGVPPQLERGARQNFATQTIAAELKPNDALFALQAALGVPSTTIILNMWLQVRSGGPMFSGSFKVPTAIEIASFIDTSTQIDLPAGRCVVTVSGRRVR